MSKLKVSISGSFAAGLFILLASPVYAIQTLEAAISFDVANKSVVVTGKFLDGKERRDLTFMSSGIGVSDLGKRLSDVTVKTNGQFVPARRVRSAEYTSTTDISGFSYHVDLSPLPDTRSAAHSSWMSDDLAAIFLDDILPLVDPAGSKGVSIRLSAPAGWSISKDEKADEGGTYNVSNIERAVFLLSTGSKRFAAGGDADILMPQNFLFSGDEASAVTSEMLKHYTNVFAGRPTGRILIAIVRFPQANVPKGVWEAETRGRTIFLVSSDMPFRGQSLQRLQEQLRHEMFHLWLPNGVNLTGHYDWFYEGFGMYAALKAGVALNQIRFEDMLDTLSRAHSIDRARTSPLSLLAASRERWTGAETSVYARGMVTAFLCDLELLRISRGKVSVETILRRLFKEHRPFAVPEDGNAVLLRLFDREAGLSVIAKAFISGGEPIDLAPWADAAGLENVPGTSRTSLRIKSKLTGAQKTVLDELGYNNWRKLNRK